LLNKNVLGVTSQPVISGVSFIGSQAKYGGALFVPEQILTIQNSLFTKNKATSLGGAIASFASIFSYLTL